MNINNIDSGNIGKLLIVVVVKVYTGGDHDTDKDEDECGQWLRQQY